MLVGETSSRPRTVAKIPATEARGPFCAVRYFGPRWRSHDALVVDLAVRRARNRRRRVDQDRRARESGQVADAPVERWRPTRAVHRRRCARRRPHTAASIAESPELGLDGVEVDAQAERLDEPGAPPDDLEHAVGGVEAGEVTGRQLFERRPVGEVGLRRGVAEHDVGPAVDELADIVLDAVDRDAARAALLGSARPIACG